MKPEDTLRDALTACMPFIDDAEDVYSLFPDSAASKACRAAVASARAALATSAPRTAIPEPSPELLALVLAARRVCEYGPNERDREDLRKAGRAFHNAQPDEWKRRFNGVPPDAVAAAEGETPAFAQNTPLT